MKKETLTLYQQKKEKIKSRLNDFKKLSEEEMKKEFLFCILTPQSNAQRCWQAVENISNLKNPTEKQIAEILRTRVRFHNTKAKRIINALQTWEKIRKDLDNENVVELRNWLAENVNGYGLKESGHFLRNIGKSNNEIAILDRHILRNLLANKIINEIKIKNKKNYFEVEKSFIKFASEIGIPADELDLFWWSEENGEIFK